MPTRPFIVAESSNFLTQPDPAGEKLIFRSTSAADTSPLTLTVAGLVAATPSAEDKDFSALDGRIEQETASAYESLTSAKLDAAPAGAVAVYGQGTKASGSIALPSGAPAAASTVNIGLDGFYQAYTFRAPAEWTILCTDVASLSQGDYLDVVFAGVTNRFWFDIDNAGTGAPANPGTLTEVDITTAGTAADVATALQAGIEAITGLRTSLNTATITVIGEYLGTMTVADGAAATGFTLTSTVAGSSTATAGNVVIGADRFLSIRNLAHAVVLGTGSGTFYGSDTTVNAYVTPYTTSLFASSVFNGTSHSTIYLRDKLATARLLAWVCEASDADFSVVAPSGGQNGTQIATLDANGFSISLPMNFANPTLATNLDGSVGLLLARATPTSEPLYVGGHASTLRLKAANYANAVVVDVEASDDDGENWYSLGITIDNLDNNDQSIWLGPVDYLRLKVNTNANTADVALHAVVICP
jgi:hypothetical protein